MLSGAHASGDVEVVVHLEGLIDPARETERINREIVSTTAPSPNPFPMDAVALCRCWRRFSAAMGKGSRRMRLRRGETKQKGLGKGLTQRQSRVFMAQPSTAGAATRQASMEPTSTSSTSRL